MAKFITLSLILMLTTPLAALADATSTPQKELLKEQEARLQAQLVASGKLGGEERAQLTSQRRSIQDMIQRLEAGKAVDPKEIDRLVGVQQPMVIQKSGVKFNTSPKQWGTDRVVEARQAVHVEKAAEKPFNTPPKQR